MPGTAIGRGLPLAFVFLAGLSAADPSFAAAGDKPKRNWIEEKCVRYSKGWDEAVKRFGKAGLGADFLARHDAFLASGCTRAHDVCARSPEELKRADVMVIVAMNAGMASTFPPFGCPK
jgi:hypothetical protein